MWYLSLTQRYHMPRRLSWEGEESKLGVKYNFNMFKATLTMYFNTNLVKCKDKNFALVAGCAARYGKSNTTCTIHCSNHNLLGHKC